MRAVVVICVAISLGVGCAGPDDPLPGAAPSTTTTTAPVDEPTTPTTEAPSIPETTQPAERLTRPIIDPDVCESFFARGGDSEQKPLNPDGAPLTLFARPSDQPVPIMVLANRLDGPAGPFALIERFFDRDEVPSGADSVRIGETEFFVRTFETGNGEVSWVLGDGSLGYLRSRGLDRDTLVEIVAALSPRPIEAPIPGFDYRDGPDELEVVVDQLNTDPVIGNVAGSECRIVTSDFIYRTWLVSGAELYQYALVIDRPPPIVVDRRDDAVVIVAGLDGPGAPTADDIRNADAATWQELLHPS